MNTYLANGGDNYTEIKKDRLNYMTGDLDTDVLKTFIEQKCPTESNQKNRINIICGSIAEGKGGNWENSVFQIIHFCIQRA